MDEDILLGVVAVDETVAGLYVEPFYWERKKLESKTYSITLWTPQSRCIPSRQMRKDFQRV